VLSAQDPFRSPIQVVLEGLHGVRARSHGYQACCPAHADKNPSLSIDEAPDGTVLIHCHAGCSPREVVSALGLQQSDLFSSASMYPYYDENGVLLYVVLRHRGKRFEVRSCRPDGTWVRNANGVRRVLYRLPELMAAIKRQELIYITEGEKDADNLAALGLSATTNPFGAGKWLFEYSEFLRGASVVILADNDDPGRSHANAVASSLTGVATEVRLVELSGLPPSGDISDWLTAGGTAKNLTQLVRNHSLWSSAAAERGVENGSPASHIHESDWPILSETAL
jgi:putative DNA primase/helicase